MLCVKKDLINMLFQVGHGIMDNVEVLFFGDLQGLFYMEIPCLAEYGYDRSFGFKQGLQGLILGRLFLWPVRTAKGNQHGIDQPQFFDLFEILNVPGV